MKTCKTCKHSLGPGLLGIFDWNWEYAKCHRGEYCHTDPVSGKKLYKAVYCSIERKYAGEDWCGPAGVFWEPK